MQAQSPNLDQQGIPKSCVMDTSSSLCSRVSREGQEGSWTDRLEFGVKARGLKWRLTGMLMVVRITGPGHRGNETQKGGRGCLGWDSPPGKAWTAAQRPTREVTKETQGKPTHLVSHVYFLSSEVWITALGAVVFPYLCYSSTS